MLKRVIKIILFILIFAISLFVIIYCDLKNVITNLGLSVSFWSGMVAGAFPIALTIYLWKKEEKDRIKQVAEESKFQKKLIIRIAYINYFEDFLEQINEYIIFIESFMIRDKNLLGEKEDITKRIASLIGAVYLQKNKIWEFDYRVYAFKSIDIDIYNYDYNEEIINLKAYLPYIQIKNALNSIYNKEELTIGIHGGGIRDLSDKDIQNIAKSLLESKEEIKKFLQFLETLKKDIEERIVFD
ncbi:MAG: hypothetical protein J6B64_00635 [Bacilli bacterium]|nr:hypothetical protein [Bacilli bacterium]MBP3635381.1 hypothetical protein [Bacilli bacterium]